MSRAEERRSSFLKSEKSIAKGGRDRKNIRHKNQDIEAYEGKLRLFRIFKDFRLQFLYDNYSINF